MRSFHQLALAVSLFALALAPGCGSGGNFNSSSVGSGGFDEAPSAVGGGAPGDVGGFGTSTGFNVWVTSFGDSADQEIAAIAVAANGAVVVTGSAAGSINFGDGQHSGGKDADVVVAMLSPSGVGGWSRRYGDSCAQHGTAVALAADGDVVVAGDFCGTMEVSGMKIAAADGDTDAFVARLDKGGYAYFTKRLGGKGEQRARAAAMSPDGDSIVVGSFQGELDLGAGVTPSAGKDDTFVIAFDPEGEVLWTRTFGGAETDVARSVAVDAAGNVVLVGSFGGAVDFGGGPLTAAPGQTGAFVVALDAAGKHLWSRSFVDPAPGEPAVVEANSVAISDLGEVVVTGSFTSGADFGMGTVLSAGSSDVFLTGLDATGKTVWMHTYGGPGAEVGTAVAISDMGNIALVGDAQSYLDLGGPTLSGGMGDKMAFQLELSAGGSSAVSFGALTSLSPTHVTSVGYDANQGLLVAGGFKDTLSTPFFGVLASHGGQDAFLARLR